MDDPRVKLERVVLSHDLNSMIQETWGRWWDFQQSRYYDQGTFINRYVHGDDASVERANKKIAEWLASPETLFPGSFGRPREETVDVEVELFLTGLCHKGLLEEGPITIRVYW